MRSMSLLTPTHTLQSAHQLYPRASIDFYLSHRRNAITAKRFLKKMIKSHSTCDIGVINTDKNPAYGQAIKELKQEGALAEHVKHL